MKNFLKIFLVIMLALCVSMTIISCSDNKLNEQESSSISQDDSDSGSETSGDNGDADTGNTDTGSTDTGSTDTGNTDDDKALNDPSADNDKSYGDAIEY